MSTEPYPEVNVDESGIGPQQEQRGPDWPKKIRTLTANEIDRWAPVIKAADVRVN
jgi:hypothetical protein